ncbi:aldehyde dehydrogenase family protein [Raoultella ornithinolytica]|nr:aldehyde dehydrogenase family protein [Raoultella ornithinolytica]
MLHIDKIYINGEFVTPHGSETFALFNPATEEVIGQARLADEEDARRAIAAAKAAFPCWSRTTKQQRLDVLERMYQAVRAREADLREAIVTEYGAPASRSQWMAAWPAQTIKQAMETLASFEFVEPAGRAQVVMTPVGVAGLITPWNSDAGFICSKLATAMAAGCTAVIKPSEMSAWQTQIVTEALHAAQIPAGVVNIVTGRGEVVGDIINHHPDIAKISFTGSTAVGKHIIASGAQTLKRVTLELGGKSPTLILDDADMQQAVSLALAAGFMNSGQACIAGTRILVPAGRLAEFEQAIVQAMADYISGDPRDAQTTIGPVLVLIPYQDQAQAIAIANDTTYGLSALVLSGDRQRGQEVALAIESGRVLVNTLEHEPQAPFGGFKQSGLGREMGKWGMQAYLEPKTMIIG